MPAAVGAAIAPIFGVAAGTATALAIGQVFTSVLVNLALGALSYVDENGDEWCVVGADYDE